MSMEMSAEKGTCATSRVWEERSKGKFWAPMAGQSLHDFLAPGASSCWPPMKGVFQDTKALPDRPPSAWPQDPQVLQLLTHSPRGQSLLSASAGATQTLPRCGPHPLGPPQLLSEAQSQVHFLHSSPAR
ncbi:hypothetical protein HJG60_008712 [Phyllostomus discolor]|uniref:Uncharacterized protein n=1 Tax=Phyllostomus discolor TaxID=89673 RepID=A0A834DJ23_9CHIR|nr:hypothetical protein HJG60_008712 [Phyllostomus discolor]